MIDNDEIFNDVIDKYFDSKSKIGVTKGDKQTVINEQIPEDLTSTRLSAEGNIKTIDEFGQLLSNMLNTAWGNDWGKITSDIDKLNITMPLIIYSTNLREITTGSNIKPKQTETIKEVVDGKATGDAFIVYRQSFDCIVEFNFCCDKAKDSRDLMNRFEETMLTFTGYLKKNGVREIYFIKEVPAQNSLNYMSSIPMTCLHYFLRLERNNTVRVSTIKRIEDKIYLESTLASEKKSDVIQNNITYKGDI
ncbi:hypothetical protein B0P06_006035 [Clostridium saccharoperbutylacetonicum]|uniref:Uncharacterized protein n=2 Tax=Clostridium TaxID=1485 RepID=M1MU01_9CLOT|nr:hypothetical protein [Clostridium saccharoperbutylacetonicum]AGF59583.1 hypothetical protein Cspa_135p00230 [Clostridium saccharoperbutylacetonicum N1-4(HMT)]NRT64560.1 hypothetical protein [Clostridium saccharoperbutylacetonicum]NSB29036.1 hypothetical protein [Clostridium saccharoperbutylacetonicum]NSB46142.1 hypothetical protein [Clostridium saccharoperbutylacetonicum]